MKSKEENKKLKKLMMQEHNYPNTNDPEFQSKIYKKREFYY
tara:strand:- start:30 stop:152 length:123 start_codon:yes stop_codon:yes gene_type:complete